MAPIQLNSRHIIDLGRFVIRKRKHCVAVFRVSGRETIMAPTQISIEYIRSLSDTNFDVLIRSQGDAQIRQSRNMSRRSSNNIVIVDSIFPALQPPNINTGHTFTPARSPTNRMPCLTEVPIKEPLNIQLPKTPPRQLTLSIPPLSPYAWENYQISSNPYRVNYFRTTIPIYTEDEDIVW